MVTIRRATEADSQGIVLVMRTVVAERAYSAIDEAWTIDEERRYLRSLSAREALHVAIADSGQIVGVQSFDLWAPSMQSMRHVGQLGTFQLPEWRRRGVGGELFQRTVLFARSAGYSKIAIQVRASNVHAQAFYQRLGFQECGRLRRQVRIDGQEDDEVLMEYFL